MSVKIDYKRELRSLYSATDDPGLVDVPELSFLMIDGHGDPNTAPEYAEAVKALYSVAYTLKLTLKRTPGGVDYTVMPLEGLWWVPDMSTFATADKDDWDWTMLILQPEEVTHEAVAAAAENTLEKHPELGAVMRVRLERFKEGPAVQVMHVGPYATEGPTIQRLHAFIAEHGQEPAGKHHEIYLSDPRRAAPERMRTIIRQPVSPDGPGAPSG